MRAPLKNKTIHQKKRYGHHQKHSKVFASTYLPYLPMTVLLLLSVFVSGYTPKHATLAFATELSRSSLLTETNSERSENGKSALIINEKLNLAAQTKAEDMTKRNYWSHNTPEGKEPWTFINTVGYSYQKAGENLAYGFATSSQTIDGWMNSPSHRENMLDGDFSEVGFGYSNSSSYNNSGEETIVVAMYGKPYVLASTSNSQLPKQETSSTKPNESSEKQQFVAASARPVSRIGGLFGARSPWVYGAVSFATGLLVAILMIRYSVRLMRLFRDSTNFVTHHPLIDSTILALIILGLTLTRTIGFIQ